MKKEINHTLLGEGLNAIKLNENFDELFDELNKKIYKLSDIKISTRTVSYWRKNNLLLQEEEKTSKNMMARFSLFDVLWLKTIERLRKFGVSTDYIKELKDILCFNNSINYTNKDFLMFEKMLKTQNPDENELVEEYIKEVKSKGIKRIFNEYSKSINLFDVLILYTILEKSNTGVLIVFSEFDYIIPWIDDFCNKNPEYNDNLKKCHTYISFNDLLEELGVKNELKNKNIFSEKELKILKQLKEENLRELTIFLDSNKQLKGTKSYFKLKRGISKSEENGKYYNDKITSYRNKEGKVSEIIRNTKL